MDMLRVTLTETTIDAEDVPAGATIRQRAGRQFTAQSVRRCYGARDGRRPYILITDTTGAYHYFKPDAPVIFTVPAEYLP